jgi:dienelactone hydrolase
MNRQILIMFTIITITIIFTSIYYFDEQMKIESEKVEIEVREVNYRILHAIIIKPIHESTNLPVVIVFHGFSASKEMMRSFAEAFAFQGFLVLLVDLHGHGASKGNLGEDGLDSLMNDGIATYNYLISRSDVDMSRIAIIGHSMGGGTALATSLNLGVFNATIVIGNGLANLNHTEYKENLTTNLLLATGQYDELVDPNVALQSMRAITGEKIEIGETIGNFTSKTARKIIVTKSDHIFEVIDPRIVRESVHWVLNSFNLQTSEIELDTSILIVKQAFSLIIGLLWITTIVTIFISLKEIKNSTSNSSTNYSLKNYKLKYYVLHSLIGVTAFVVASFSLLQLGFQGIFVAWFTIGGVFYGYWNFKALNEDLKSINLKNQSNPLKLYFNEILSKKPLIWGISISLAYFILLQILLSFIIFDFRFVLPLHSTISLHRIPLFIVLWITCFIFFLTENRLFMDLGLIKLETNILKNSLQIFLARTLIFNIILLIQFVPMFLGLQQANAIFGFLSFFIIGLVPYFLILSIISTLAHKKLISNSFQSVFLGLLIAWALTSTLPMI